MQPKRLLVIAIVVAIGVILGGCSSTGLDASRVKLYDDLAGIAGDSSVVVVAEITSQRVAKGNWEAGVPDETISVASVVSHFSPAGLAATLSVNAQAMAVDATTLSEISIRQLGTSSMSTTPAPILAVGKQYLLFLTPTLLPGDGTSDFYVTGGDAGIYKVDRGTYRHGTFESGDKLPTTFDAATLSAPR